MKQTKIEWCDSTVNPTEHCEGCELWNVRIGVKKCYAGRLTERWKGQGSFDLPLALKPGRVAQTLTWPDLTGTDRADAPWLNGLPRLVFVGDMSDIFSRDVPFDYIKAEVLDTAFRSLHIYLILTKQAKRAEEFARWLFSDPDQDWPSNLWMGVSVTNQATVSRIRSLGMLSSMMIRRNIQMPRFFVSYEPVLEPVNFKGYENEFNWLIIGGESGPGAQLLDLETVRATIAFCRQFDISPFVKQMGTTWSRLNGSKSFKGGNMEKWPEGVRVREMPQWKSALAFDNYHYHKQ